ncbi:MAG: hypothetical protein E7573_06405 [Ruminococcaceae bacterium]|nr:hypothetical protein [Oscillospiraceae bacterium]MBR3596691.1 hypothetical protein [Clostridia bacterium]
MSSVKFRAAEIISGRVFFLWRKYFSRICVLFFSFAALVPSFLALFYDVSDIFPFFDENTGMIFLVLTGLSSVFLFVFSFVMKARADGWMFHLSDKNTARPDSFYSFSQGMRYLSLSFLKNAMKLLWATVFYLPCTALTLFLFSGMYEGEMIRTVFFTLLGSDILLFITGTVFYAAAVGRYYLCEFLFFLNPLTSPRELISSSVSLMKGKSISLLFMRISLLLWKLSVISPVSFPVLPVYSKSVKLVLSEKLYGEKKCFWKKSAVVFYINRKSVMKNITASY